ncbi:MAG TPA: GGDEF domain-containing protein [Pedomonas sp.]|uniref:GGDEF domain-containing protein n=1 Tax=Pedomonas sp. TaxID=2976421 RepID=UPI002F3EBAD0
MIAPTPYFTVALVAPGVLAVFGLAFLWAWSIERKRNYLRLLAGACFCFGIGAVSQAMMLPRDIGHNALFSGAFHTLAVLLVSEGVLRRSGRKLGLAVDIAVFLAVIALLWWFFYVSRSVVVRVYVQNFSYGAVLLATAIMLRPLAKGRYVDRALFWFLLFFAVLFFPRTLLTMGLQDLISVQEFASTRFWQVLQLSLAIFGSGLGFTILAAALTDVMDDLRRERDTDPLTGVLNRRGFEDRAAAALRRGAAGAGTGTERGTGTGAQAALVACDLDHFKSINDTYGHPAGDEVLRRFGALLRETARAGDIIGRTGGEEFLVLLPGTTRAGAFEFAERVRQRLETLAIPALGPGKTVTGSFGLTERQGSESLQAMIERADRRLYAAKTGGRNRTVAVELSSLMRA